MGRWRTVAIVLIVFTALGLLFSTQTYLDSLYSRGPVTLAQAMTLALAGWYGWAVLSPIVIWLARRAPLTRPVRWRSIAVHAIASLVLTFVKLAATGALLGAVGFSPRHVTSTINIPLNYMTYWAIVGIVVAIDLARQERAERLRASQLEAGLATARLDALALQLQPHFLFNTLNSIAELMHENVDAADRMLARLGTLLRASLDAPLGHEVTLARELAFLDEYLGIERIRFESRLRVRLEIDPTVRESLVPRLLLQPIVENAVRHAVAPRRDGGTITIAAARRDRRLTILIGDDGPGLMAGGETSETRRGLSQVDSRAGVGLTNARARLHALYGDDHALEIRDRDGGGVEVLIELPFRIATSSMTAA